MLGSGCWVLGAGFIGLIGPVKCVSLLLAQISRAKGLLGYLRNEPRENLIAWGTCDLQFWNN